MSEQKYPPIEPMPMRDKFRFLVTDAADGVILHEALMSYRNRDQFMPADHLRAEAADRLLAHLDLAIHDLAAIQEQEANAPVEPAPST